MPPAVLSLVALLAAIVLSFASRLNVGILAIPLAWLVGVSARRPADQIVAGFPASLFVTLAGVTLLFALAESNGTIGNLATRLTSAARGRTKLLPVIMFVVACAISSSGPGAIPATALVAPLAFAMAGPAVIPPFLTALMVANGANAGNLSAVSAVGIIANSRMASVGLGGHEWNVWAANFIAHALVAALAYAVLVRRVSDRALAEVPRADALDRRQWLTLAVIGSWIVAVVVFEAPLGLAAFAAAAILIGSRAGSEDAALRQMPWGAIVMVCGVTMLVVTAERVGGLELFTALLARLATPETINGVIAFVTGAISSASSTSGVVLPTFLPTAPGLVEQVGGGDPLAVALSINVGSSLVDVSPLSTIGAICVAALPQPDLSRDLFRRMLVWGLSMTIVGALFCQLFAPWLARL
jgi:Na+/H+ antiporter NhaD/arsenite permease-like protein